MRKVLVVGGSSGIGAALAQHLLSQGHHVINISRNEPDYSHDNLVHHGADVTKDELPAIEELDSLVYCPGSINLKPITMLKVDDFRQDLEINLIGGVKVIKEYLSALKKGNHPSIVMFSTVASSMGMSFHASVAAAKSAVEGLVKSLAAELAPTVRVNAIAPTVTDTKLAEKILRNDKMRENAQGRHPLNRFLQAEEVSELAAYLISPSAAAISGQILQLDCGIVNLRP